MDEKKIFDVKYNKQNFVKNINIDNKTYNQGVRIGNYVYYVPCIGKGSFSKVFIGHHIQDDKLVAIKRINTSSIKKMSLTRINSEITLLQRLNHINIVKFIEAFSDVANNIYIVTEYCNFGNLELYTKRVKLDNEKIKYYMSQIRDGMKYLIDNYILHRDIKPQNFLLHKEEDKIILKIADFGFAKHFEHLDENSMGNTLCGTPMYLAPEVIKDKKYNLLTDLWSLGIILYELYHHQTPFKKPKNILELTRNIQNMRIKFNNELNDETRLLINGLLEVIPERRIDWFNFFSHDWFQYKRRNSLSRDDLYVPKLLTYLDEDSSDSEKDQESDNTQNSKSSNMNIPQVVEKSFFQQTSKIYSQPNIMNDYIKFEPSSYPTEKNIKLLSDDKVIKEISSSWTDSPILKYISSSISKITETLSLGGK
jgi:serine/threonine-protein kinase ULK/ATG1